MVNTLDRNWFIILNPHAGSGKGKKDQSIILKLLKKNNFRFQLSVSEFPRHTIALTVQAIKDGFRDLIVIGGDGTLNEAVNGILSQQFCSPDEITLGVIPVGTGNDWIKTFGIANNYKAAIKVILRGKTMWQDIGKITFPENDSSGTSYFANMAGFGFDAMVAEKTNRLKDKGRKGVSLYLQALGSSFLNYQTGKIKITIDGQEFDDYVFSVSIGIGKFNGGGMMQAPGAVPDNGLFQVTIIREIGLFGILRNLAGLYSGEFVKDHRVSTYMASKISIHADKNISGEADGEILGDHKFEVEMLDQKLNVIYNPKKYLNFS